MGLKGMSLLDVAIQAILYPSIAFFSDCILPKASMRFLDSISFLQSSVQTLQIASSVSPVAALSVASVTSIWQLSNRTIRVLLQSLIFN